MNRNRTESNIDCMNCLINNLKSIKLLFILLFTCFLIGNTAYAQVNRDAAEYKAGKTIFKGKCTSCHKINEKLVGPALTGVYDKYEREWLYSWIKNSQAMVKAGDPQAVSIFNEYNGSVMTAFALSNEEIDNVLYYIQAETELGPESGGIALNGEAPELGFWEDTTNIFLAIITFILLAIVFVLSRLTGTLGNMVKEKMGQLVPEGLSFGQYLLSKKLWAAISVALTILVGYNLVDGAQALGRQQGYQPAQPIKFSHKLHAGVNKVECQYCHSGAAKGKSAVIPSANVCMNCHKAVKEGPNYGTTEIAKIYKAVGWDPVENKYRENYEQKPIEWVRIHNLPDHVYFNHAQHVKAGGVECQECHGAIEEMEVVQQHSSLGMGWCINCHRETEVNFKGNDYYQIYEEYHQAMKDGNLKKVTVEDIGGLECQKCHY
ncbi:MAG: c-type cytochrome [Chitinophagales bacterium]